MNAGLGNRRRALAEPVKTPTSKDSEDLEEAAARVLLRSCFSPTTIHGTGVARTYAMRIVLVLMCAGSVAMCLAAGAGDVDHIEGVVTDSTLKTGDRNDGASDRFHAIRLETPSAHPEPSAKP